MAYKHECQMCHHKWEDSRLIERCPKCGASINSTGLPEKAHKIAKRE